MSSAPTRVREIFTAAVDQYSPDQWSSYLDEACGEDLELRKRVDLLLEAHMGDESILDSPAVASPTVQQWPITEKPGTRIGPYKLLQPIGEGGMGVVYMAEQKEPVKRRVALKIIKPGMDTRQVIARFEAERQALAMMDHPNIAKVLEAGQTGSGRPYFVMELVNGLPVTKYCDEQHLTPKERLELFVPICQAVQHAHQKGIIHRDLKPGNILVAMYDNKAVPKIIDFGVSKAISQTLTDKTMFTQLGQVVGTLEYMSPEQAQRNQLDVDTRSDIYSLGVVLYELLTGETPYDRRRLRSAAFDEMLRIIREEEPSKPSTKVSGSQSLPSIAANRRVDPGRLGQMIRGELDWIVMKALEKDRRRRYETAAKFADDVRHYLDGQPVAAGPPTATYIAWKFLKRHRVAAIFGGIVTASLLVGLAGISIGLIEATNQKAAAIREAQVAEQARQRELDAANRARALADANLKLAASEQASRKDVQRKNETLARLLYLSDMRNAHDYWENNNIKGMQVLLDRHGADREYEDDLRGFEWYYLRNLVSSHQQSLAEETSPVMALAISSDRSRIVSAASDFRGTSSELRIYDGESGEQLRSITCDVGMVRSVGISPDGTRIAAGIFNRQGGEVQSVVVIWDTLIGREMLRFEESSPLLSVEYSPNATELLVSSLEHVKVRDAATGAESLSIARSEKKYFASATFSHDARRIITCGNQDGDIDLWDAATAENLLRIPGGGASVFKVDVSRDDSLIVAGGYDGRIHVYDAATGQLVHKFQEAANGSPAVAFSADGHWLATGGTGRAISIWDLESGRRVLKTKGHLDHVSGIVFGRADRSVISSSFDGTVRIWHIEAAQRNSQPIKCQHAVLSVDISPDGGRIVGGDSEGQLLVWNATSRTQVMTLAGHTQPIRAVAFNNDGTRIVSGTASWDKSTVVRPSELRMWDATDGRSVFSLDLEGLSVDDIVFSPDGNWIAIAIKRRSDSEPGWLHEVEIRESQTGEVVRVLRGDAGPTVAFSDSGEKLLSGCVLWNVNTGKVIRNIAAPPGPSALSPSGGIVAVSGGSKFNVIGLWDTESGAQRSLLAGHQFPVSCLVFSVDGKRLVTHSDHRNSALMIWDVPTGREVFSLRGHRDVVYDLAFSRDGRTLVSSGPREVYVWDASP